MTKKQQKSTDGCSSGKSTLENLPSFLLIHDVLLKLDLETLCSLACVSSTLRFSVSQVLSLLPSLDLSEFFPDNETLAHVVSRCRGIKTLTLNCLRIDETGISRCLGPSIEELNLLCCFSLSPWILSYIGESCPNLRVLMLELDDCVDGFTEDLIQLVANCRNLEAFSLKIRGDVCPCFDYVNFLPKTIESLDLQPLLEHQAMSLVTGRRDPLLSYFISATFLSTLKNLSLVLDVISDRLVFSITNSIPNLMELDLEDRPIKEPILPQDLTNAGLRSLGTCHHLKSLSLARSRHNCPASFKRVNDMGIFLLSEGCRELESVKLSGFSKVTDAGFASIIHSCHSLKKLDVRNAALLSDLTFHDLTEAPCSLKELKLLSCNLITSETPKKLSSNNNLELLNLCGCWSVADSGLQSISSLDKLSTLYLAGADITDSGLSALSQGSSPIKSLSLRGCKRVTDKGISMLFHGGGLVSKTVSALDLGQMPGVTDLTIEAIAGTANAITELCIRSCFYVTDSSIRALSTKFRPKDDSENQPLRKLDLCNCIGLSSASLELFRRPAFRGLRWLGIGVTKLSQRGSSTLSEVLAERPWLTVCTDGCEMGCYDGWHFFDHHINLMRSTRKT